MHLLNVGRIQSVDQPRQRRCRTGNQIKNGDEWLLVVNRLDALDSAARVQIGDVDRITGLIDLFIARFVADGQPQIHSLGGVGWDCPSITSRIAQTFFYGRPRTVGPRAKGKLDRPQGQQIVAGVPIDHQFAGLIVGAAWSRRDFRDGWIDVDANPFVGWIAWLRQTTLQTAVADDD